MIKITSFIFFYISTMICWTDSLEIAINLSDKYPEINPRTINFVDLRNMVMDLDEFEEGDSKCGERVLEAIQMNWIDEVE